MSQQQRFTAFILAHGLIRPVRQPQLPSADPNTIHYKITSQILPQNTRLYSPKILGNAYYDRKGTDVFISKVISDYYSIQEDIRPVLEEFCLRKITEYEREHTDSMKKMVEDMDITSAPLFHAGLEPFTQTERDYRKQYMEGITHKMNTEWCEHTCFINEKTYQINRDNCILLFGKNTNPRGRVNSFSFTYQDNNNIIVYIDSNYYQIKITFRRTVMYTFNTINDFVNIVMNEIMKRPQDNDKLELSSGRPRTPEQTVTHYHNIAFFDFTCCTVHFPLDRELYGMNAILLSVKISPPLLVYGTIQTDVVDEEKKMKSMLTGTPGMIIPGDTVEDLDDLDDTAALTSPVHSTSVSVKSTPYLFVTIDDDLKTFISTINVDEASLSVSPGKGGRGGRHRVSNRNRNRTRNLKSGTRKQKRRYNVRSSRRRHRVTIR